MKILILGANGMIGSAMLSVFSSSKDMEVFGTVRTNALHPLLADRIGKRMVFGVDTERYGNLEKAFNFVRPDVVINCVGVTKHRTEAEDPLVCIATNSLLPHRLVTLCELIDARLIHISTDCVFSGEKGFYTEDECTNAVDLYGKSKALGEVHSSNAVTLRTSTIGHEFGTKHGLLEWFLAQGLRCRGFRKAIFSGLPTVVFAEIVRDQVVKNVHLSGLFNVAAAPIDKFELLNLIANVYQKKIEIIPDDSLEIDRSLNATRFREATGYVAPPWPELVSSMYSYR